MKLEQQVCSLELAKRLKELGVKQETYFVWWYTEAMSADVKYFPDQDWGKREWSLRVNAPLDANRKENLYGGRALAAFTVAELGEMLPDVVIDDEDRTNFWLRTWKTGQEWAFAYTYGQTSIYVETALTEADARAKMLIYLIENNLITPIV